MLKLYNCAGGEKGLGFCESPFSHGAQPWLQSLEKCGSKNLFDKSLTFILGFYNLVFYYSLL
jgi:hypothetical protein